MNKWHVYEKMKAIYERTSRIPTLTYLRFEFPNLSTAELEEGYMEFMSTKGQHYETAARV